VTRFSLLLTRMCRHLCVLVALAVPLAGTALVFSPHPPALAQSGDLQRIVGTYTVQGQNPNGSTYRGTATISLNGSTVQMRWNIAGEQFSGSGALVQGILTIDWGASEPVVYKVNPNGTLTGVWAGGQASETLSPRR